MQSKPIVTITGVSGFIGSQVCLTFLKTQRYQVRGTVRSKANAQKIGPLKIAFGEYFDNLELVEADLLDTKSMINACKDSKFIVHTASPVVMDVKNEDELIKPAVNGTLAVMEAALKNKTQRVVITSSVAAIARTKDLSKIIFTEKDWSDLEACEPYSKSKTLAEKAAWEFLANLKKEDRFELVTINPSIVFGPSLVSSEFAIGGLMKKLMLNQIPGIPRNMFSYVDVRDVAEAHLRALEVKEANGQRFILASQNLWFSQIGEFLHEKYGNDYVIPHKEVSLCMVWVASWFNAMANNSYKKWGIEQKYDTSSTKKVLGINFIDAKTATYAMANSLIENGYIPDQRKKKQ